MDTKIVCYQNLMLPQILFQFQQPFSLDVSFFYDSFRSMHFVSLFMSFIHSEFVIFLPTAAATTAFKAATAFATIANANDARTCVDRPEAMESNDARSSPPGCIPS